MDFFESLVKKFTIFLQSYRISCLVQLLRIRFHKMLNFISMLQPPLLVYPPTPFSGGGGLGKCGRMGGGGEVGGGGGLFE